jgi:hypothetical protein
VNGDVTFPAGTLRALLAAHRAAEARRSGDRAVHACAATLLLTPPHLTAPGARKVALAADGTIQSIDGVCAKTQNAIPVAHHLAQTYPPAQAGEGYGYGCALVAGAALLQQLPDQGPACLKEHGFWPLLRHGGILRGFVMPGEFWRDLGTAEDYLQAHFDVLRGDAGPLEAWLPWDFAPQPSGIWVHGTARVHPTATLLAPVVVGPHTHVGEGATVGPFAFVDERGEVAPGAWVSRAVLWPGARVDGRIDMRVVSDMRA